MSVAVQKKPKLMVESLEHREAPSTLTYQYGAWGMLDADPNYLSTDDLVAQSQGILADPNDSFVGNVNPNNPITIKPTNTGDFLQQIQNDPKAVARFTSPFQFPDINPANPTPAQASWQQLFRITQDKARNTVSGAFMSNLRFSYNPALAVNAPANFLTTNGILQNVHSNITWYSGGLKGIVLQTQDTYFLEAFKVNPQNNTSFAVDTHSLTGSGVTVGPGSEPRSAQMIPADALSYHVDFQMGIGNYNNQPINGNFSYAVAPQATPVDATKVNWAYGTSSYSLDITLTQDGSFTFQDESVGTLVSGKLSNFTSVPIPQQQ
jgi:hypothetical protein